MTATSDNDGKTPPQGTGGTGSGSGGGDEILVRVLAVLFVAVIILINVWQSEEMGPKMESFLRERWILLAVIGLVIVGVVAARLFGKRFTEFGDATKGLLVTLVAFPVAVLLLNLLVLLEDPARARFLIILFVLVAAILPASMYYLFLITRRPSLFDEYVTNLQRLGLMPAGRREVDAYIQKFEAVYGPINPVDRATAVSELSATARAEAPGTGDGWGLKEKGVGSLMTPSILVPLGIATLLIGLGWLLVLPVWEEDVSVFTPFGAAVGFGFLGAYFYSLQAIFRRFLRRDLRPAVYVSVSQRIVLTLIATWVLIAVLQPGTLKAVTGRLGSVVDTVTTVLTAPEDPAATDPTAVAGANAETVDEEAAATDADTQPVADEPAPADSDQEPPAEGGEQPGAAGEEDQDDDETAGEEPQPGPEPSEEDDVPAGEEDEAGDDSEEGDEVDEEDCCGDADDADEQPASLLVLAFLVGMFPRFLWDFLANAAGRLFGARRYLGRMHSPLALDRIDGLSFWHESRLEEEDIENAPNLAACDLVELMLNTRFAMNRLIDWVDQAILVTTLGSDESGHGKKLRAQGIRTASALLVGYEKSGPELHDDRSDFEQLLTSDKRSAVRTLADTLSTNPNLALVQAWQRSSKTAEPSA